MANASDREIKLHPLVLINISDHFTRTRMKLGSGEENAPRVFGVLFGTQKDHFIDIFESFEIMESQDGTGRLDGDFLATKMNQFNQVFPDYDLLGWYCTGRAPLDGDHVVHNQIMEINENPLLLYLDTLRANKNEDVLPLKVYESRTQIVEGTPKNVFIELAFKVGAIEPERIAIDHVAKMTVPSQGSATLAYAAEVEEAVVALKERVQLMQNFLKEVSEGNAPMNHRLLRRISAVCNSMPLNITQAASARSSSSRSETELLRLLATSTRLMKSANDALTRHTLAYDGSSAFSHMMGGSRFERFEDGDGGKMRSTKARRGKRWADVA